MLMLRETVTQELRLCWLRSFLVLNARKPVACLLAASVLGAITAQAVTLTGDLPLLRTFDRTLALVASPITVTATLTNLSTNALRGFYYFEQVPSAIVVTTVGVTL